MIEDRILIVDDETSIRRIAQRSLSLAGYSVTAVASGTEAVEACRHNHFALVLTDLKMPGMSGEELLHKIKEMTPTTDVIIMTAYPALESAIRTLKAGAYDYVLKPFELADLEKVVQHCLERQRLERELGAERHLRQKLEELNRVNAQLYKEGEQKRAELQRLSAELRHAQENERRRMARELHDGVAQILSSLSIHIDLLDNLVTGLPSAKERLGQIKLLLEQALNEVRGLVWTMRPPALDDLGLPDALRGLVANLSRDGRIDIALQIDDSLPALAPIVATTLYRIIQEALSNVLQHSHASQVSVHLGTTNGTLHLTITDNGQGFDPAALALVSQDRRGIGLWSMRERAEEVGGTFSLRSAPGQGTTIVVTI